MAPLIRDRHSTIPVPGETVIFTNDETDFLINNARLQIFSGELHYFRVPRPYWRDRLLKAKAMGLNTICTYMPWNLHEPRPGEFDFEGDGGMLDVTAFVQMAGELGLWVVLRPGPYICAEWDFGGLPGWLLTDRDLRLRCSDTAYVAAVNRYILRVGDELSHLTCGRGGPIVMVQVENEYGSFANDAAYLRSLRQTLIDAGLNDGTLLFTSDGPQADMLAAGTLENCLVTANFGSKAELNLAKLRDFRPNQPIMCGEFWCGWFDQWGKSRQGSNDPTTCETDVSWMVENNASFSIYMFHGGTNFGFTAGANHYETYAPTVTGYDYWALLDEAGRPTQKYDAVRQILAAQRSPDDPLIRVPTSPMPIVRIARDRFHFHKIARLEVNLPEPILSPSPRPMEQCGQFLGGAILYRTRVTGLGGGKLTVVDPHDYAAVYLDGRLIGTLDRRLAQTSLDLPTPADDAEGRLDIVVWAMGHVNYGPKMLDLKGISDRVELKHLTLTGWEIYPLPMDRRQLAGLRYDIVQTTGPAFHHGVVELEAGEIGDTFLDTRSWNIGCVWVNGHNLGRFWQVGPQQTLFCPGCWLKEGVNEIVIFDMHSPADRALEGLMEPILDEVRETPVGETK